MRIVIKVGTSSLTHETGRLNIRKMEQFVKVLADVKNAGHEVILVSSGAIAMGVGKLNLPGRPTDLPGKQAAAAVGQCELMYTYDKMFTEYHHTVAQILLTAEDVEDPARRENFENTLNALLRMSALPVINENDTVATSEITLGDNDTLGATVAVSSKADLLVLFSDIDGLYDKDPHRFSEARLIPEIREITPEIEALGGGAGTKRGTGGMITKLHAAKRVMEAGLDMVILNSDRPEGLYEVLQGQFTGTRFIGKKGG
ncbi:MAG: glutamate 5-kinase [Lachnospiraceae bacterium]|nr:glutamate 5-kinase [Lachnospiraceae bacterium]